MQIFLGFLQNIWVQFNSLAVENNFPSIWFEREQLDLLDNGLCPVEPLFSKDSLWLLQFGHSNSLCSRATRAITNHTPIDEYRLRFFFRESFACPCGSYPIKTRRHVLYKCQRFNNYWNPRRDSLSHFSLFLQFNPSAFVFT